MITLHLYLVAITLSILQNDGYYLQFTGKGELAVVLCFLVGLMQVYVELVELLLGLGHFFGEECLFFCFEDVVG